MIRKILLASIAFSFAFSSAQINQGQMSDLIINGTKDITKVKKVNLKNQILSLKSLSKASQIQIVLPTLKSNEKFVLIERDLLSPSLRDKFPDIKSYYGYSLENPQVKITASYSPSKGFSALIYGGEEKQFLSRVDGDTYGVYGEDSISGLKDFNCGTPEESAITNNFNTNKGNPTNLRKYRLAVATDYEYNLYHAKGGAVTVEKSLAAVVEALSIVAPVYENDLSIFFELVNDMDKVTFITKASDPYTTTNLNSQTQIQLDSKIGSANYDLGILFTNKIGGGNAGAIGSVCKNSTKGSAYIGYINANTPEGFSFAIAAGHEMGHQFGGNHTHARNEGYAANREIGSGVTVMGYPGVTGSHDVAPTFVPQFFNNTMVQINNYLAGQTCGIFTPSTNNIPVVNAGGDYYVPQGTAFKLTGSAVDADNNDKLTYSWEQNDPLTDITGSNFKDPSPKNLNGANYRVYEASDKPIQYFPPIKDVLNGNVTSNWNEPPTVSKTMNFVLSVRDNKVGGGQTGSAAMKVNVTNDAPFKINNINLNQTIKSGQAFELKWDVSGTDTGNINAKNVKISLTTDNGETFTTLVESTSNDGSEFITIPSSLMSKKANIIVEAIGNIFYAASPTIAVDYEISLTCQDYYTPSVNIPDGSYVNQNLVVNDSSQMIEDISVITDITHARSSDLIIYLAKGSVENLYRPVMYKACANVAYPNYVFSANGGSLYANCSNPGTTVQPMTPDYISKYIGTPVSDTYYFRVFDNVTGTSGKINKLGLKICRKTETTLNTLDISTGINNAKIFPNPSNGNFNVRYNAKSKEYKVEIYNVAGQVVNTTLVNSTNKEDKVFNLQNLAKGLYLVKIIDGDSIQTQKLIIR